MAPDLFGWLEDLAGYVDLGWKKLGMPRAGGGEDYTQSKYKNVAAQVIHRLHPPKMTMRVNEIIKETPSSKTFRCERLDDPMPPFRAGQYVNLFCEIDGVRTSRPLSIASAPGQDRMDLTVREKPGGFVSPYLLSKVKVGQVFETSGPAGGFYHEPLIDGKDLVFIAGGSGITPFMSILRRMDRTGWPLNITLLYGCRTPRDVIFGKELDKLSKNFSYTLVVSEPPGKYKGLTGFMDAAFIKQQVGDVSGKTFYLCGPNVMYDFCLPELAKLGVPRHKIKRELYGPPDNVTGHPGWPKGVSANTEVEVRVVGYEPFVAKAGEPLINSLERNGFVVPALCRSGECSYCRTKLLSGKVYMPPDTGIRESDAHFNYIHACVTYPLENIVIRVEA